MQKIFVLFFSLFIFNVSLFGQSKADYRQKFTEGNYLILEGNYTLALQNFQQAYQIDSTNSNINFKVGLCYMKSETEKSKALYYLEKAVLKISRNRILRDLLGKTEKRLGRRCSKGLIYHI